MKIEEGKTYRGLINGCLIKITEIKVETGVFKDTVVAHYIDLKSNRRGADTLSHMGNHLQMEEYKEEQ